MGCADLRSAAEAGKPYILMTLNRLSLAVHISILNAVLHPSSAGAMISATVLALYQNIISAALLSFTAILFERNTTPWPSPRTLAFSFLIGFLQFGLGQLMMTSSLRYVTASFQSVALNMIPAAVFVLAVASGRERFSFWDLNGQAKLWGILASVAGSTVVAVLAETDQGLDVGSGGGGGRFVGCVMVGVAVVSISSANLLVERVAMKYPYDLTLAAMMNTSGAVQTAIFAALTERNPSSWRIRWRGSLQLFSILYGGIVVTGFAYGVANWCNHRKGPVFTAAFLPLLIVFSFFFETLIFGRVARIESVVGAVLVAGGLYILLWAKLRDSRIVKERNDGDTVGRSSSKPLLRNKS